MPELNGLVPYRTKIVKLAAGEIRDIPGRVKFILLLSATSLSDVSISFNGATFSAFPPGLSLFGFETDIFYVKNTSLVQNDITLAVGESEIRDSRVTIDAANPLPVTITNTPAVTVSGTGSNNSDAEAVKASGLAEVETYPRVFNGATWDRLRGDTNGIEVQGPVAAGAAAAGNPQLLGGPRTTDGAVVRFKGDVNGAVVVRTWDGTNFMPTMDAAARRGYQQLTDGTNVQQVVGNNTTAIGVGATVLPAVASTAASTQSYTTGRAAAPSIDLNGRAYISGQIAANTAIAGNPVGAGGYDGTNMQWIRVQADNSAVGSTGNQACIIGKYDSAVRTITSGNIAFPAIDRNGRQVCMIGGTLDPALSGYSTSTLDVAATTNATSVKASAGMVYGIDVVNTAAYAIYLRMYNKASAPTVGTDVSYRTYQIAAGGNLSLNWPAGQYYSTGIAFATTKLAAYNDATALVAHDAQITIQYA